MLPFTNRRSPALGWGDFVKVDCAACQPRRAADAGRAATAWAKPGGEGSRPQRTAPVSRVRKEGAGGRFDQVGSARQVSGLGVDQQLAVGTGRKATLFRRSGGNLPQPSLTTETGDLTAHE